ncbi:hypothetical protein [Bosea sp. (in: a-proteobacteria)]|uniref:hypothetical protein n=1 Tax=Bosea sp. (in: a-proteobacteria) TaxID=1871050 RepID=UPI002B480FD5|nr:hypothetical protein [Bosea sp. (in: a-proteobacteria)]WRH58627.1 MAG: hypothetical protein RSE11_02210 [Bosea sp. (in: a-proteobacteria)]
MLAYDIEVNGKRVTRAGMADWAVMSVTVTMVRTDRINDVDYRLAVHGMSQDREDRAHHARWKTPEIAVGSEIAIKIVECEQPNAPTKRYRSDIEVQENPFTEAEVRELRYQTYLELKAEFEGDHTP